jgi:hypothetical protein
MSASYVVVTKEQFFGFVGPRDIVTRCERDATYWETRNREVVGISTPGYIGTAEKVWKLSATVVAELKEPAR